MPDTPAETLRAAAQELRSPTIPGLTPHIALMHPDFGKALTKSLESAAEDFDMCERINSRDPYNDGKTRVMPHHLAANALAVARALLGGAE